MREPERLLTHISNPEELRSKGRERWTRLGSAGSSVAPRRDGFRDPVRGLKPTPTITKSLRDQGNAGAR